MNEHQKISRKGGRSGRGDSKARTTEQARAAALAGWEKRRQATFQRDEIARELATENAELLRQIAELILAGNALAREAFERGIISQVEAWDAAVSSVPNDKVSDERSSFTAPLG